MMHGMIRRLAMDNYKYRLQYIDNDNAVDYEFDANLDIFQLENHLKRFLAACSWCPETINKIFVDDNE